jgi:hypothetical protein
LKIRESDDKDQSGKVTEISSKIEKLGMNMKKLEINNTKPVGDIVSTSAKWINTPSHTISQKRINISKQETRPKTPIVPKEYISL